MLKLSERFLFWLVKDRPPDFLIDRRGEKYLHRWWLIKRNPYFNIYLHRFLGDDIDEAIHSHPWLSLSLILSGGYYEITEGPDLTIQRRWYNPGRLIYRWCSYAHRIELGRDCLGKIPCVTLFITGPKVRDWGFKCKKGYIPWWEFLGKDGKEGKGCD